MGYSNGGKRGRLFAPVFGAKHLPCLSAADYKKVWKWPIQRRCILFFELLHRMEQGFADTTTSRQGTEE
jgi:hypothetical protein